jgi:hypothetical protein
MKTFWKNESFQIRWCEPLGTPECPYAYRWVFIFFNFSIRVHHFLRSEPIAHQHDHAWNFVTLILKGGYLDVSPNYTDKVTAGSIRYRNAEHVHNLILPKGKDCWTIIFTSKPVRKWGFWVKGKMRRPLQYFHKFGYMPCE